MFTPEPEREAVSSAAFQAGAGRIGAYEECSFAIPGEGTFFGTDAANPTVGERGRRETVRELRLEIRLPGSDGSPACWRRSARSHSYEEPAIDVYPLHETEAEASPCREPAGSAGWSSRAALEEFAARRPAGRSACVAVAMVGDPHRPVQRVAVACGAGDDFLKDAARAGADVLLTGEARFHRAHRGRGTGHRPAHRRPLRHRAARRRRLAEQIALAFPNLTVWPSRTNATHSCHRSARVEDQRRTDNQSNSGPPAGWRDS